MYYNFELNTRLAQQGFTDRPEYYGVIRTIRLPSLDCIISLTKHQSSYLEWNIKDLYDFSLTKYLETLLPDMFVMWDSMQHSLLIGYVSGQNVLPHELDLWLKPLGRIVHKPSERGDYILLKIRPELHDFIF